MSNQFDISPQTFASMVCAAGTTARHAFMAAHPSFTVLETKSSPTDMVTSVDYAVERALITWIKHNRPDDDIVAEESPRMDTHSAVQWIIDPIDGTTNLTYGHPGYNISIAVAVEGKNVAGIVMDLAGYRSYLAWENGGAWCNGKRLTINQPTPLSHTLIATGFGYDPERRARQGKLIGTLLPHIRDIRRMGAAALDLCHVASGRVDAYFEVGLQHWDWAAGSLIATEAGASLQWLPLSGESDPALIVAHPQQIAALTQLISTCASEIPPSLLS